MNELIERIIKEYVRVRVDAGDLHFDLRELKVFLGMLDYSTLGDICADLHSRKK